MAIPADLESLIPLQKPVQEEQVQPTVKIHEVVREIKEIRTQTQTTKERVVVDNVRLDSLSQELENLPEEYQKYRDRNQIQKSEPKPAEEIQEEPKPGKKKR